VRIHKIGFSKRCGALTEMKGLCKRYRKRCHLAFFGVRRSGKGTATGEKEEKLDVKNRVEPGEEKPRAFQKAPEVGTRANSQYKREYKRGRVGVAI